MIKCPKCNQQFLLMDIRPLPRVARLDVQFDPELIAQAKDRQAYLEEVAEKAKQDLLEFFKRHFPTTPRLKSFTEDEVPAETVKGKDAPRD